MPVSMTHNGTKYYLHYDQVGSLRAVTDTSGNIVKEVSYDSYGNILSDSNEALNVSFGFAGGLYDSDTKITRFGYREYDATTGKWTAKDPIDFDGGDSNLYGYVLGDPVNFIDYEGLKSFREWLTDKVLGKGESELRKKKFCDLCLGGISNNMSDSDACSEAGKSAKTCGTNASCREDYAKWVVDGCVNTCK